MLRGPPSGGTDGAASRATGDDNGHGSPTDARRARSHSHSHAHAPALTHIHVQAYQTSRHQEDGAHDRRIHSRETMTSALDLATRPRSHSGAASASARRRVASPLSRRSCLRSLAAWSARHTAQLHACMLMMMGALLLFQFILPYADDSTRAPSGAPSAGSASASFDVQLRLRLQRAFVHVPSEWADNTWRPMLPLSAATLANPDAYDSVPRAQWPPGLACGPFNPEWDMWTTLSSCLLGTYFSAQRDAMPTLMQFFSVQPTTINCSIGRFLDVDPSPSAADANPLHLSPGLMLQSYLSLMSLSAASSTHILHSSAHPWWRWARRGQRAEWRWADEDANGTIPLPVRRHKHVNVFDMGEFLQFRQWEVSRKLWDDCPADSVVRTHVVRPATPLGSPSPPATSRQRLEQDVQAIWSQMHTLILNQTDTTAAVPFRLVPSGQAQPALPVATDGDGNPAAVTLLLPSYTLRHVFDPRVLQVVEIRLWYRHTVQNLIHTSVMASLQPALRPALRDRADADASNHFLPPSMVRATADTAMRAGYTAAHLQHGFTRNADPSPAADPLTWNRDRYGPVEFELKRQMDDDAADSYNSFEAVFDTYYDNRLHVALVIKQAARMRKVRAHEPDDDSWPGASAFPSSTRDGSESGVLLPGVAVPLEYLSSVVSPTAVLAFVKRWRSALPSSLRDAMRISLFFDCIGCDDDEDAQSLRVALVRLGLEPRLHFNLPIATQIQLVALSDVQMYFCVEEEDPAAAASAALGVGSCAMAAYLRSEPLKLLLSHPRLADLYPHVRNVMRMELVRGASAQSQEQLARRAQPMHVQLPDDEDDQQGTAGDSAPVPSHAQQLRRHFPALPHSPLRMIPLSLLESTQQQRIRFLPPSAPSATSASAAPPLPAGSESDAAGLTVFIAEVERVWKRKLRRLSDGGVPAFLDNYQDDFPAHKILTPTT